MSVERADFEIPPNVLHREVDGQIVLLNLDSEQYFGLDEIGADMVRLATTGSREAAVAALAADYEATPDVLGSDLDALMHSLVEAGLLLPKPGPA